MALEAGGTPALLALLYHCTSGLVVVINDAIQTRDYCAEKNATLRTDRPDPSLRKERSLSITTLDGGS
jgi:hypothetical protein